MENLDIKQIAECIDKFTEYIRPVLEKKKKCPHYLHMLRLHLIPILFKYRNIAIFSQSGQELVNKMFKRLFCRHTSNFGGQIDEDAWYFNVNPTSDENMIVQETKVSQTLFQMIFRYNEYQKLHNKEN